MMPAQSGTDVGIWTVPGHAPVIEYPRSLLNEIVVHVCDAYESYLGGGVEVGGVLFGHRDRFHVRILAFRPLKISPPRPSFVLSEADSQRLNELIRSAQTDPALDGMVAVGWYHSHTRSEVFLSEGDIELYSRHFPEPWQIAMVLHPSEFEPVRIGFFFRESDGFIRTDQSYQEFAIDTPPRTRLLRKSPPWKLDRDGHPEEPPLQLAPEVSETAYELAPEHAGPQQRRRFRNWAMALLALMAIAAGSYSIWLLQQPGGTLGLRASAVANELHLEWDSSSPAVRKAERLELTLVDGGKSSTVTLPGKPDAPALYVYQPKTSRVDIILKSTAGWGHSMQERITFLTHPSLQRPPPELEDARRAESEMQSEVQSLREQLRLQQEEAKRWEAQLAEAREKRDREQQARRREELLRTEAEKVEAARREAELRRSAPPARPAAGSKEVATPAQIAARVTAPPAAVPPPAIPPPARQPAASATGPAAAHAPKPANPPSAAAPRDAAISFETATRSAPPVPVPAPATQPAASLPGPAAAPPPKASESARIAPATAPPSPVASAPIPTPVTASTPAAASPAATPPPATPAAAVPAAGTRMPAATSGRLIWVGDLPKGAELSIQGRKPSRGSIVGGELPQGPVRVGAYAAELGSNTLRVFTANPALAAKPRVEPPSAANGWNTTEYVYDPKSVNQVIVERTPAASGNSSLTLRAGSRKVSVIVIEWQIANP
jgi:proteasome lid subunit RPN8/RPN11